MGSPVLAFCTPVYIRCHQPFPRLQRASVSKRILSAPVVPAFILATACWLKLYRNATQRRWLFCICTNDLYHSITDNFVPQLGGSAASGVCCREKCALPVWHIHSTRRRFHKSFLSPCGVSIQGDRAAQESLHDLRCRIHVSPSSLQHARGIPTKLSVVQASRRYIVQVPRIEIIGSTR